ncbi:hypothetical protein [Roseateles sp. P5_E11]
MEPKRFDERFVLEADLRGIDYTDKIDEVHLATPARVPTGLSIWLRPIPAQVHPGLRGMGTRRIRLHVIVDDPQKAGAPEQVRRALHLDEDAELPF